MLEHKPQPPTSCLGDEKYSSASSPKWTHASSSKSSGYGGSSWDEWRDQHTISNTGKTV